MTHLSGSRRPSLQIENEIFSGRTLSGHESTYRELDLSRKSIQPGFQLPEKNIGGDE